MADFNQTNETMNKIAAKVALGLPLTDHEKAMQTLYGNTDAAPTMAPSGDVHVIGVDLATGPDRTVYADEHERKAAFVRNYLSPLLAAADVRITKAEYTREKSGEEYVTVTHNNGYMRKICVSADSHIAIVCDVIRGCGL